MSFTWNLIKVFIMSHKANFNDRQAGALKVKILLDLRNLEETEREVLCLCRNTNTRSKVLQFVSDMRESLIDKANIETQTDFDSTEEKGVQTESTTEENDLVQVILEKFSRLENDEDILYVVQNLFHIQTDHMKVLNIIQAFQTLEQTEKDKFYQFMFTEKSLIEQLAELIQFGQEGILLVIDSMPTKIVDLCLSLLCLSQLSLDSLPLRGPPLSLLLTNGDRLVRVNKRLVELVISLLLLFRDIQLNLCLPQMSVLSLSWVNNNSILV